MDRKDLPAERRKTIAQRPPEPDTQRSAPLSPLPSQHAAILALQRTAGNRAVAAMSARSAGPPAERLVQRWYTAKKPLPKKTGDESKGTSRKRSLNPLTMFGLGFFHRQIFFDHDPSGAEGWLTYGGDDVGTGLFGARGPSEDTNRSREDYTPDGVRGNDDDRMRKAVTEINRDGDWDSYNIATHNCQHFVRAVLKKRQDLERQEKQQAH